MLGEGYAFVVLNGIVWLNVVSNLHRRKRRLALYSGVLWERPREKAQARDTQYVLARKKRGSIFKPCNVNQRTRAHLIVKLIDRTH